MGLEFRKGANGELRPTWYAGLRVNGKRTSMNLGVKIMGKPPASLSLRDKGDAAFERSRARAHAKLQQVLAEARESRDAVHAAERVLELKTGEKVRAVRLEDLPEEWAAIPRRRPPAEQYAAQCRSRLEQFVSFVRERSPRATEIVHVNREMARAFMDAEEARGITDQTWNGTLKLLRTTFKHLMPTGMTNPFATIPTRETATVSRKPFSPEDLKAILQAAAGDDFVRPILVTAICTAMRKGDCCRLRWEDVDLAQRFITVKTSKTGQRVDIPIFPMLYTELSARRPSDKDAKGYVFPEQAKMYAERPHSITRRVRKVLEAAGFGDGLPAPRPGVFYVYAIQCDDGSRYIGHTDDLKRRWSQHREGTAAEWAAKHKPVKIAHYEELHSREEAVAREKWLKTGFGRKWLKREIAAGRARQAGDASRGEIHATREKGLRQASVRDFHSFRVTWVTLALTARVPMELVRQVTGHATDDIVRKHYFRPNREAFRQTLEAAMPGLLLNGTTRPRDEAVAVLDGMTAETWEADRGRLRKLIAKIA